MNPEGVQYDAFEFVGAVIFFDPFRAANYFQTAFPRVAPFCPAQPWAAFFNPVGVDVLSICSGENVTFHSGASYAASFVAVRPVAGCNHALCCLIPNVTFVELDFVSIQQLTVFGLEGGFPVMLFLFCDVFANVF